MDEWDVIFFGGGSLHTLHHDGDPPRRCIIASFRSCSDAAKRAYSELVDEPAEPRRIGFEIPAP